MGVILTTYLGWSSKGIPGFQTNNSHPGIRAIRRSPWIPPQKNVLEWHRVGSILFPHCFARMDLSILISHGDCVVNKATKASVCARSQVAPASGRALMLPCFHRPKLEAPSWKRWRLLWAKMRSVEMIYISAYWMYVNIDLYMLLCVGTYLSIRMQNTQ